MTRLFRTTAVQNMSAPEQLNNAVQLTGISAWLTVGFLAMVAVLVVAWLFLGTLPRKTTGLGVTEQERSAVLTVEARFRSRVTQVRVHPGQRVAEGERLLTLEAPERREEIEQSARELELREEALAKRRQAIVKALAERERNLHQHNAGLQQTIRATREQLEERQSRVERKLADLEAALAETRETEQLVAELLAAKRRELRQQLTTRDDVLATSRQLESVRERLRRIRESIDEVKEGHARFQFEQRDRIARLKIRMSENRNEFEAFRARQEIDLLEREGSLMEHRDRLTRMRDEYRRGTRVAAPAAGVVEALAVATDAHVQPSQELVRFTEFGDSERLRVRAYFDLADAKKVAPGMEAQVALTSVETEVYGTMDGVVEFVGNIPVNAEEVSARFGNRGVARFLVGNGAPRIPVLVRLIRDEQTVSGFQWSSLSGPPTRIGPGYEASVTVVVAEERPVNLIAPILRTWTPLGDVAETPVAPDGSKVAPVGQGRDG